MVFWCFQEVTQQTFTCSKSTIETLEKSVKYIQLPIKTSERRQWHRSGVFIINFKQISQSVCLYFLLKRFPKKKLNSVINTVFVNNE